MSEVANCPLCDPTAAGDHLSLGEGTSASVCNALPPVGALMEQLQVIVLPENAHNTATSGHLKEIEVSNTRAFSLTPWDTGHQHSKP